MCGKVVVVVVVVDGRYIFNNKNDINSNDGSFRCCCYLDRANAFVQVLTHRPQNPVLPMFLITTRWSNKSYKGLE